MPKISIIIRTKNEEKWITLCLNKVFSQTIKDIEVIIVDNNSLDYTLELAKKFPVKVIKISNFTPGKAINDGVRASTGEYFVCLSAHCIPKHEKWLENLLRNFKNPNIAGVYGKQEALPFSSDTDKRDLLITFGLDHRIQKKDYFFHNANSMIRRDVWNKIPFNEKVTNIEDRLWGKAVIEAGYNLVYEPEAEVFHYHGIHQDRDKKRCENIVRIIEKHEDSLPASKIISSSFNPQQLNIVALLPVRGRPVTVVGHDLLERCINYVKKSLLIKKIFILSDDEKLKESVLLKRAEFILRPKELSSSDKTIEDVLQFGIKCLESKSMIPDIVLYTNYLFPFRPNNLITMLINNLLEKGLDTVITAVPDYQPHWTREGDILRRLDDSFMPRERKKPLFKGLIGLGCVTYPKFLKNGYLLGDRVGIVSISNLLYGIKVQMDDDFSKEVAGFFLQKYKDNI
jgi:rhamnosyltransferase